MACQRAMSSPVSTPKCGSPLTSIASCVRQKRSIASATNPTRPDLARRLDLADAIPAGARGLAQHARVGLRQRRIGEQSAGCRHLAARQIDGGGGRPMPVEQLGDCGDGGVRTLDQRMTLARVVDCRRQCRGSRMVP